MEPLMNTTEFSYNDTDLEKVDPTYSSDVLQAREYVLKAQKLWIYMSPCLILLGMFGNSITILVLCRKSMWKMASSPYLVTLGIVDILVLFLGCLRQWLIYLVGIDVRGLSSFLCKLNTFLVYTVTDFSVWILVAVSVERFICVCFPFKAKRLCTRTRAKITLALIFLALATLNCHFFFGLGSVYDKESGEVQSHCSILYDEYNDFQNDVWPWIDLSAFSMVPFLIIIVCNICLMTKIGESFKRNKVMPSDGKNGLRPKPSSMTALLVALNTLFLFTTSPISIYLIGYPFWYSTGNVAEKGRLALWWAVVNQLMYLNNSVNFIFYCLSGPRFRRELKVICACHKKVGVSLTNTQSQLNVPKPIVSYQQPKLASAACNPLPLAVSALPISTEV